MQVQNNYSNNLITFIIVFRKYLRPFELNSPEEYFLAHGLKNPNEISKMEFYKMIQPLQQFLNFDPFQVNQIFKELDGGWDFIPLKKLAQVYSDITTKIPFVESVNNTSLKEQQEKRIQQEKERKNKKIKSAFEKLQNFMHKIDAIQFFKDCDEDSSGKLDPKEFNKLLARTEIKEFEDKEIRRYVLAQIFYYFPAKEIKLEDYIKLFKIKKMEPQLQPKPQPKKQMKFFVPPEKVILFQPEKKLPPKPLHHNPNQTVNEKKIPSQQEINININAPQNPNKSIDSKPKQFKKKTGFEEGKLAPMNEVPHQAKKEQMIEGRQMFPKASEYFRNGQPQVEELRYLEQLEILLKANKVYKDKKNPRTPKGQFKEAKSFFNGANYQLFQMAQSVILREKSRIGIAREIQPKDIIQGELGDCYFLSSIASLISIYPEIISQKFLFSENPANYFVLKLFFNGEWRYIPTDDQFPTSNGSSPCFAKPHGRQIWVMLLEKCWAKCFDSYQGIVSGNSKQAFAALTGAPTEYFSFKTKDMTREKIEAKIKDAYKSRYVVTASGSDYLDKLSQNQQEKIGLVSGHAYSFLKFIDADGNHLVKIRNPWGSRVWKGDWSFESNKWTKSLRDRFNYNESPDDGSFYMSMQDFLKYFSSFVICKVNPINVHTSLKMSFGKHNSNYVRMKATESGRYLLSLYQDNERQMRIKYKNFKFSPARIIVMKSGKEWDYIDSCQDSQSYCTSVEVDLEAGFEYIISSKFSWVFWDNHEGCLTAYGPDKVIFERMDKSIASKFKAEMIEGFFKKNRGKISEYSNIGAVGAYSESFFSLEKGIGYYFITNPSAKQFQLTHRMSGSGFKVIKPQKLPFEFDMKPGTRYLKGFFISTEGFNYQSSQSIKYY